jgi:PI-3-kinase-related kinase SMG-1
VKELELENLDLVKASILKAELERLAVKTPALYDELLSFANESINDQNVSEFVFNKAKLVRQESVCQSPRKGTAPARDPTTGKGIY